MGEIFQNFSLLSLVLTLGAYQFGLWCQKKWKTPMCHPILISVVLVIGLILLTGAEPKDYQAGMETVSWMLTPVTVCLALPLYTQLQILRKNLPAVLAGITAGTVASLLFILGMCLVFRLDSAVTVSLLPKSVTTAMGLALSEQSGGITALTSAAIFVTGVLGSLMGPVLCKLLHIHDPIAQGVAFGTSSHVVGTSRATEMGSLQGAVSSLSLALAGLMTAALLPFVCMLV